MPTGEKKGENEIDERMEKEAEANRNPADENEKPETAGMQGMREQIRARQGAGIHSKRMYLTRRNKRSACGDEGTGSIRLL